MTRRIGMALWLALLAAPAFASEQARLAEAWRAANAAVAEFPRGHADVLKWEAANLPPAAATPAENGLLLATPAQAVSLALAGHADLANLAIRLGKDGMTALQDGNWQALSPVRLRQIDDSREALEVAHAARQSWLVAVAARQQMALQQRISDTHATAAELGQRLVAAGSWSAQQQLGYALKAQEAKQQSWRSTHANRLALNALAAQFVPQGRVSQPLRVADSLPALPEKAMDEAMLQTRLASLRPTLGQAEASTLNQSAGLAYQTYLAAWQIADSQWRQVLPLQQQTYEETVLRYNGMLKHTWDVLDAAAANLVAQQQASASLRDFWLAEADLQLVLQGGKPASLQSLAAGGEGAAAAAPH